MEVNKKFGWYIYYQLVKWVLKVGVDGCITL